MEYEGDKFYVTKAGDTYNAQNDPPEKCTECGVWQRALGPDVRPSLMRRDARRWREPGVTISVRDGSRRQLELGGKTPYVLLQGEQNTLVSCRRG